MELKEYFYQSSREIETFLDGFFWQEQKKARSFPQDCVRVVRRFNRYVRGGKMVRGGLVRLGYELGGGRNLKAIVAAGAAVELYHSFLLVHDDWIDADLTRRGKPTIHVQYEADFDHLSQPGDRTRWSAGMAFVLGDIGCFWATQVLAGADFPPVLKAEAIVRLTESLVKTGYGEILDIGYDLQSGWDWDKILQIRELKTAYYTLVMPLQVGLNLAGAKGVKMAAAEKYGQPVGTAFQLHDDYLGLFGDEGKTGKSASSDLQEGKKTLLIARALRGLRGAEKKRLFSFLGRKDLTGSDLQTARRLVEKSGAVEANRQLVQELVAKGKKAIPLLTTDLRLESLLRNLADYLVTRER